MNEKAIPTIESTGTILVHSLKDELRALIRSYLDKRYISASSLDNIPTGNRYQTVMLDGDQFSGFRADRSRLFERFNFIGRSVLDCGCNLGELSRLARLREARLVDGFEYDEYFVQIGQVINAVNNITRVSLYKRDLTNPDSFTEDYEIALAFSVFPYISKVLDTLLPRIKEALILETHDVKPSLAKTYIAPLVGHFPHYTFVDITDHSKGEGRRVVMMFCRREETLRYDYGLLKSTVDIARSAFGYLKAFSEATLSQRLDPAGAPAEFLSVVNSVKERGDETRLLSGVDYWLSMIKGYVAFKADGLRDDNPYLVMFKKGLASDRMDQRLSAGLTTEDKIQRRVALRFTDVDKLRSGQDGALNMDPIRIVNPLDGDGKNKIIHGETGRELNVSNIDGYHRIFWAKLLGIDRLPSIYHLE